MRGMLIGLLGGQGIGLAISTTLALSSAQAADFSVVTPERDGHAAVITINGRINLPDGSIFAGIKNAIVFLASPGGIVTASIHIGETIRSKGLQTAVSNNATYASGCALAWLGGTERFVGSNAHIGFHAPGSKTNPINQAHPPPVRWLAPTWPGSVIPTS